MRVMTKSPAGPARKPRSRYHHGDLRHALLLEAVRTIGDEGVAGLTLREVGHRLGVSRTALYRHFSDKSSLLAAVARDGFQRFAADLRQAWLDGGETRRGLDLMGVAYVRFAVANPAHYRVMFGDYRRLCAKDPDLQADAARSFDVLLQALIALQAGGDIRRDEPRRLAHFIWAIVHGIAMLAIDGQLGPEPVAPSELNGLVDYALARMSTGIGSGTRDQGSGISSSR
jgi:AcrR family transcriptional regulator